MEINSHEESGVSVKMEVLLNVDSIGSAGQSLQPLIFNNKHVPITSILQKVVQKCQLCNFKTHYIENLNQHKARVHKEFKFTCQACLHQFSSKYYMEEHIRTFHDNEKLICEHCSEAFTSTQSLNRHKRVKHEGVCRFTCPRCNQKFNDKAHFQGHMNSHMESKPFACQNCGKKFNYKNNMKRHELCCGTRDIHIDSRYRCEVCDTELKTAMSYKDHMVGKHGEDNKMCLCGKRFTWRSSFLRHIKKCKHNME